MDRLTKKTPQDVDVHAHPSQTVGTQGSPARGAIAFPSSSTNWSHNPHKSALGGAPYDTQGLRVLTTSRLAFSMLNVAAESSMSCVSRQLEKRLMRDYGPLTRPTAACDIGSERRYAR